MPAVQYATCPKCERRILRSEGSRPTTFSVASVVLVCCPHCNTVLGVVPQEA